jgi:GNAT superfamily N-acetyltransferase
MRIRLARPEDCAALPEIERSAAELFRGSVHDAIADDDVSSPEFHQPLAAQGLVWVAERAGALLGFASCENFEDALHIWELAVRRAAQGAGVGRALVMAAVAEAARRGAPAVTLTTFRDVAWNAPFYASCGFVEAPEAEFNARLRWIRTREEQAGLEIAARCAMRLDLSGGAAVG